MGKASVVSSPQVPATLKNRNFESLTALKFPITIFPWLQRVEGGGLTSLVRWREPMSWPLCHLGVGCGVKGHLQVWTMWSSMNLTWGEAVPCPFWGPEKFLILWGQMFLKVWTLGQPSENLFQPHIQVAVFDFVLPVGKPVFCSICVYFTIGLVVAKERSRITYGNTSAISGGGFILPSHTHYCSLVCHLVGVGVKQE